MDSILIRDLELSTRIGVPDAERARPQRVTVSLELTLAHRVESMGDEIGATVDYFVLTRRLQDVAAERPRRLIETLAGDLAACVLAEFPVARVTLELRKYILPDTRFVAVRIERGRGPA